MWVRDMEPGPGEPEYILRLGGQRTPPRASHTRMAPTTPAAKNSNTARSPSGARRSAQTGSEVAFVTTAVSDLVPIRRRRRRRRTGELHAQTPGVSGGRPRHPGTRKPPSSAENTNRCTGETTDGPVSGRSGRCGLVGAVYPGHKELRPRARQRRLAARSARRLDQRRRHRPSRGWGRTSAQQARMLPGESPSPLYTEPLWRRIAPGSQTPTERVTGGSDPDNPACVASGESGPRRAKARSNVILSPFETGKTDRDLERNRPWRRRAGRPGAAAERERGRGGVRRSALPVAIGTGFGTEDSRRAGRPLRGGHDARGSRAIRRSPR